MINKYIFTFSSLCLVSIVDVHGQQTVWQQRQIQAANEEYRKSNPVKETNLVTGFFDGMYDAWYEYNHRSGQFKVEYRNGVYDGNLKEGVFDGHGIFYNKNGSVYKGEWKNGLRSGSGIQYYKDGGTYEGEWENNSRHGLGKCFTNDGEVYEGYFKNGNPSDFCTYFTKEGLIYQGAFVNFENVLSAEVLSSEGVLLYRGEIMDKVMCGYGELFTIEHGKYEGFWNKGQSKKVAKVLYETEVPKPYWFTEAKESAFVGRHYDNNGNLIYVGQLKELKYDGIGVKYNSDKPFISGIWEDGVLIKPTPIDDIYNSLFINHNFDHNGKMNTSEFSGKLLNIKYDFKYKGGYCDDCIYLGQTENGEMSGLGEVVFYNSEDKKISLSTGKWVENCKLGEFKEYYKNGTLAFTGSYDTTRLITGHLESFRNGRATAYYDNGNLFCEGQWVMGKVVGNVKLFRKNGTLFFDGSIDNEEVGSGLFFIQSYGLEFTFDIEWSNSGKSINGTVLYKNTKEDRLELQKIPGKIKKKVFIPHINPVDEIDLIVSRYKTF